MNILLLIIPLILLAIVIPLLSYQSHEEKVIRIGYFPNVNHSPAIVAIYNRAFDKAVEDLGYRVEYFKFNAGTEAIHTLLGGSIDITYTGSVPAIIGYVKSEKEIKMISGVSSGGALFIVRSDLEINSPSDLSGKRIVAPDYGNTQDISLRSYLIENGLKPKMLGGDIEVLYAHGSETLILFSKKSVDGAWVAEPWATILLRKADSKIFVDESELWNGSRFATTVLVARSDFIDKHRAAIERILEVHLDTTRWINEHKSEAAVIIEKHIEDVTRQDIESEVIIESLNRIEFTHDPMLDSISIFAERMYVLDIFNEMPDIRDIYQPLGIEEDLYGKA